MRFPRASGVLLHVTSLPGPYGIGDLGPEAYRFVDFLKRSGQRVWQILPVEPPALDASPYNCHSAFAGNPLLISPQRLVDDGWLEATDLVPFGSEAEVNFQLVHQHKSRLLHQAFQGFRERGLPQHHAELRAFRDANQYWLDDYALFAALVEQTGSHDWTAWDGALAGRSHSALTSIRQQLDQQLEWIVFQQFVFHRQLTALKTYANAQGVKVFGDMPIFVAHGSSDVWANQDLFLLSDAGRPLAVAGVPPDYFSKTGQLWGNPLFRWDALAATGYTWWLRRLQHALARFDMLRIDHFRGFEAYWQVPATAQTAQDGQWVSGPGRELFDAAAEHCGELPIVAEDLGMITEEVHALREQLGFPGMRVLQFGFDNPDDLFHRPESYPEHCVAYTGTHDNDTLVGWYRQRVDSKDDDPLKNYLSGGEVHRELIRQVARSRADTVIVPLQDILGLPSSARMNTPGTTEGNWQWRCPATACGDQTAAWMRSLAVETGRLDG